MKSFLSFILAAIVITFINGCSTPAVKTIKEVETKQPFDQFSPESLLLQATTTDIPSEKTRLRLKAAEQYYNNGLISQASTALKEINYLAISQANLLSLLDINLRLGVDENLAWHTQTALTLYNENILDKASISSLEDIIPRLATAFQRQEQRLNSAILLIEYSAIIAPLSMTENNEKIWGHLRSADPIELNNFQYINNDINAIAWLELAKKIQQNQINLESQHNALKSWQAKWPNHPASLQPPKEIALLSLLPHSKASKIILALPLTGPVERVGSAVRDGFMASYYNHLNTEYNNLADITLFDTNIHSVEELYKTALSKQALIIGPLTKKNVNKLATLEAPSPTILALNYLDTGIQDINNNQLFQFGLNPETEIHQLSKHLSSKGLSKIAYIGPETDHGFRIHDTLLNALNQHQSHIIEAVYYNDQKSLSPSVAKLLGTDSSLERKRTIQRATNLSLEFEPRRRKDIDAIFMLAKPTIAKQLNPLFAYHYAKELPIYSSSQIHQLDDQKNDLDNIHFIEMPWMLSNSIEIKNTITETIPNSRTDYSRFYALGSDAYQLFPRLQLLKEIQNSQIQGQTGTLSISPEGIVERELELVVFKRGKATLATER